VWRAESWGKEVSALLRTRHDDHAVAQNVVVLRFENGSVARAPQFGEEGTGAESGRITQERHLQRPGDFHDVRRDGAPVQLSQ
jgi:hypothetical protein